MLTKVQGLHFLLQSKGKKHVKAYSLMEDAPCLLSWRDCLMVWKAASQDPDAQKRETDLRMWKFGQSLSTILLR